MSAATDKARFYLEKYVPELQEYERKQIFSRDEVQAIATKRSDFEHILNARGSTPGDYARYATYEMNLDSLRNKRCKRLGIKNATTFNGQRTVFFILDRATKKFPGALSLWMQYVNYCKQENASKKLAKVFTSVLRLHPRHWNLWVLAAKHYAEAQGDMNTARSYLQRGLRFCPDENRIYAAYMKLEMVYLAKLAARRKVLGLDGAKTAEPVGGFENGDDVIALPEVSAEDLDPEVSKGIEEVTRNALEKLANAPAFAGAIPIAIFDAAMANCKHGVDFAEELYELTWTFNTAPSATKTLQHIISHLQATAPKSPATIICEARMPLFAVDEQSADFPSALGSFLPIVNRGLSSTIDPSGLTRRAANILLTYLRHNDDIDEGVAQVLDGSIKRYLRLLAETSASRGHEPTGAIVSLVDDLKHQGRGADAEFVARYNAVIGQESNRRLPLPDLT